ncbi:hypothetical protein BHECKSOX_1003 [Bathymodiolus heckerae thiotrophic gill symbiont]|nr:hypothetical protein [uncultured Gammaproteobacteria bacterium]SHN90852.1 hypothetical protein BHECKSOX_1003 [Bathymodiolus heckerae thiotrophic gill symbiont]
MVKFLSYKTSATLGVSELISQFELIITPNASIVHITSAFDKLITTIHENN